MADSGETPNSEPQQTDQVSNDSCAKVIDQLKASSNGLKKRRKNLKWAMDSVMKYTVNRVHVYCIFQALLSAFSHGLIANQAVYVLFFIIWILSVLGLATHFVLGYRKMSCYVVTLRELRSLYRALEMMILDLQQQIRLGSPSYRGLENLKASINYDFLGMENHCYQVLRLSLIEGIGFTLIVLTLFCLGLFGGKLRC
ncbi:hypothetical protein Tsubulata_051046 [Turnera subulata]|uniref:Uncharacterized protein n=1 Tax=Turnera subulata TaxID=218843 RepID=A0A9Q0JM03_9ROSI|nr:hypothetical protein Tsubulata_051046 [Turnera subulata]